MSKNEDKTLKKAKKSRNALKLQEEASTVEPQ